MLARSSWLLVASLVHRCEAVAILAEEHRDTSHEVLVTGHMRREHGTPLSPDSTGGHTILGGSGGSVLDEGAEQILGPAVSLLTQSDPAPPQAAPATPVPVVPVVAPAAASPVVNANLVAASAPAVATAASIPAVPAAPAPVAPAGAPAQMPIQAQAAVAAAPAVPTAQLAAAPAQAAVSLPLPTAAPKEPLAPAPAAAADGAVVPSAPAVAVDGVAAAAKSSASTDKELSTLAVPEKASALHVLLFGLAVTVGLFASGLLACVLQGQRQEKWSFSPPTQPDTTKRSLPKGVLDTPWKNEEDVITKEASLAAATSSRDQLSSPERESMMNENCW